jgi:parallel beta-helix repeat protein
MNSARADWRNVTARRVLVAVLAVAIVAVAVIVRFTLFGDSQAFKNGRALKESNGRALKESEDAPRAGTPICGRPLLHSPWNYNGKPGTYTTSDTPAGLPTFGAAGTDFPHATSLLVVAAGDNTSAAVDGTYQANNAVVYFEPGNHTVHSVMYTGDHSAYVGGYNRSAGPAIINGLRNGTASNSYLSLSKAAPGDNVDDTWEYLTIENYTSSTNNWVMGNENGGHGVDNGDTYIYDTIGPNEYAYTSSGAVLNTTSAPGQGGGYGIGLGSGTTIKDSCLIQNAQGAFNGWGVNNVISRNEISANGLGEYPDSGGNSPNACGCSGGGKLFYSLNAQITRNYIHDNYNAGIWLDFDNTGANISGNYISSNWGVGIEYEASYNANISNNTLVGNGWASDGAWPAGYRGNNSCYGGVPCSRGFGAITGAGGGFPYAAIYLPNSGGNSNLSTVSTPKGNVASKYSGQLLVRGNRLTDNFGGVMIYTDTNRYPGNINSDSACSVPLGALDQPNSGMYYQQTKVLTTKPDATISGSSVTSPGGTTTLCDNYGTFGGSDGNNGGAVRAPSVGMAVYDLKSGAFLGTVAAVTSAAAFSLSRSPGDKTGASLLLSAYGGCGPADYFGGGLAVSSGIPSHRYWDNCIWGSRNVTISGNAFSLDAGTVTGCTVAAMCGVMAAVSFNAGVPALMQFFDSYQKYIADASGNLRNVWSGNAYTWIGSSPRGWRFQAGAQGTAVTRAQWQASPYRQDVGSTFRDVEQAR